MNRTPVVAAFLGLVLGPAGLFAQDASARIEAARQRAASAGIPTELIDVRVAEGRAKGVPLDRIALVVERRATALAEARQAMESANGLNAADLSAGADAVEAGIDGGTLRAVIQNARTEDRPVAIAVLTFLHSEAGLPVGDALNRVRQAMGEGPDALRNLPAQAAAARERRGPPEGAGPPGGPPGLGGAQGGPPAGVPAPGERPGRGRPNNPGNSGGGGGPG
ncbi:MAG: hypothetical protein GEU90_07675 [Gemmatimonas sp.]|nr:hypothetical protein [Gemmatimonas sp.]